MAINKQNWVLWSYGKLYQLAVIPQMLCWGSSYTECDCLLQSCRRRTGITGVSPTCQSSASESFFPCNITTRRQWLSLCRLRVFPDQLYCHLLCEGATQSTLFNSQFFSTITCKTCLAHFPNIKQSTEWTRRFSAIKHGVPIPLQQKWQIAAFPFFIYNYF